MIPTPPWYSTATLEIRLLEISLRLVRSAPVASGLSTPPSSMPLPQLSGKTLPRITLSVAPLPKSSPAAPRRAKPPLRNCTWWAYENDTLAGSLVHDAYGQVPPGANWHSPCTAYPLVPVMV